MQHNRKYILAASCIMALAMTLAAFSPAQALFGKKKETPSVSAFAKSEAVGGVMNFSREDFETNADGELSGIIVTSLPDETQGTLTFAGQPLSEGNVVAATSIGSMSFIPTSAESVVHTNFKFIPVFSETGAGSESVTVSINLSNEENSAPIAQNASFETYCDLKLTSSFKVLDPDGDECSFTVTEQPKYGTVTVNSGTFTYTPTVSKEKDDSFSFKAADQYGNISKAATVTVSLHKRDSEAAVSYTDMAESDAHYASVKLAESGVLRGEMIGTGSFLYPDKQVSRAQFVSMISTMYSLPLPTAAVSTGMGDNDDIPTWAKPCIAAALDSQIVTGEKQESGNRIFRASDAITKAETAVIIDRILELGDDGRTPEYTDAGSIPEWATQAVINTVSAGYLPLESDGSFSPYSPMTREDTVRCLYNVAEALASEKGSFFNIFD